MSAAASPALATPPEPPRRPGFVLGLRCLFGGLGFLLRHPRSWPLAAVPMAVLLVLTALLSTAAVVWLPGLIDGALGPTSSTWTSVGASALQVLGTALAVVLSAFIAFGLAQPLSGPALEALVRLQERQLGAPERPPTGLLLDVLRSLQSLLVGYGISLPFLAVLLVVAVLFPPAVVVTTPLKLCVLAIAMAWDLCDYPLSIRGLKVGERVRLIARHRTAVFGFGAGIALISLLPCMLFLCLPAGVVGAARLVWHVEQWESAQE